MINEPSNTTLLEELHKDEEELHKDEKRINLAIFLLLCFVIIFSGVTAYFRRTIRTLENKSSQAQNMLTIEPTVSVAPAVSQLTSATPHPSIPTANKTKNSGSKQAYINTGFGTNQSADWADVFGAATTADIGEYTHIKEVRFEAFINVPTSNGTVSVRLYNKTDNHPVWNSEVTKEGTIDTYHFISPVVTYDSGPKLYQVQMKSQLNVVANLVQSRIAIVTE